MPVRPGQRLAKVVDGTGGFAAVAAFLSDRYGVTIDRRQIHTWANRGTLNKDRQPFPEPLGGHDRWVFSLDAVAAWYAAGVPGPYGKGWMVPRAV